MDLQIQKKIQKKIQQTINFSELTSLGKSLLQPVVITVGKFATLHLGHQRLIRRLVETANAVGGLAMVVSIDRGKKEVFSQLQLNKGLTQMGVDVVLSCKLEELRALEYDQFLRLLQKNFDIAGWVSSDKLRIGYSQRGTPARVKGFFSSNLRKNKKVAISEIVPSFFLSSKTDKAEAILSSTYIRGLFTKGDVGKIRKLCYFPVAIEGTVVRGEGNGKKCGYPTANQIYPSFMLSTFQGSFISMVYRVKKDSIHPSFTFVGTTGLRKYREKTVETHLFNFSQSLYNERVVVFLLEKLRENLDLSMEKNPRSVLLAQLERDSLIAEKFFRDEKLALQALQSKLKIKNNE